MAENCFVKGLLFCFLLQSCVTIWWSLFLSCTIVYICWCDVWIFWQKEGHERLHGHVKSSFTNLPVCSPSCNFPQVTSQTKRKAEWISEQSKHWPLWMLSKQIYAFSEINGCEFFLKRFPCASQEKHC